MRQIHARLSHRLPEDNILAHTAYLRSWRPQSQSLSPHCALPLPYSHASTVQDIRYSPALGLCHSCLDRRPRCAGRDPQHNTSR